MFTTTPVYLRNAGTIDIKRIYARFANLSYSDGVDTDAETAAPVANDIGSYIKLVAYAESNRRGFDLVLREFREWFCRYRWQRRDVFRQCCQCN